ncbi:pleckstrin homology domain-containing family B member 2 isoform 2-T2 [Hipposideros larvatus]
MLRCAEAAAARVFAGEKMVLVKSGWLLRQSTILKRWKKNWFDLWSDGHLVYYDDQTRQSVEDKVHMPVDCINIHTGHECRDIQPPDGKPKDCVLQIVCRDGKTLSLCAESMDDCFYQERKRMEISSDSRIGDSEDVWKKWPGNLHSRTPGQIQLMLAQKSCMMTQLWLLPLLLTQPTLHLRHMAMVHMVVHTRQELKLSMLRLDRFMLYPTSTHMQDFMDSSLPTKSSFMSGIKIMTVIWPWACWQEQPQAWPWSLCSGSSRVLEIWMYMASDTLV